MIWTIIGSVLVGSSLGILITLSILKIKNKRMVKKADKTQINSMEVKDVRGKTTRDDEGTDERENNRDGELYEGYEPETTTEEDTSRQGRNELPSSSYLIRD